MNANLLDSVATDLFSIPPLIGRSIRRKILKTAYDEPPTGISPAHIHIMKTLRDEGTLRVTEIGHRLLIRGPQMTHLIDRLVKRHLVERKTDPEDRRAVMIALTDAGCQFMEEHDRAIMDSIRTAIAVLDPEELDDLSTSLRRLRDILLKLE